MARTTLKPKKQYSLKIKSQKVIKACNDLDSEMGEFLEDFIKLSDEKKMELFKNNICLQRMKELLPLFDNLRTFG